MWFKLRHSDKKASVLTLTTTTTSLFCIISALYLHSVHLILLLKPERTFQVQLEGFFCPKCDFKTTQRSQFIDHKRREHRRNDTDAGDVNRNRFVEKFHKAADDGKKKKKLLKDFPASQVSNSRYFCCYCGLEQGPKP